MDLLEKIELRSKGDAEVFAELFENKLIFDHEEGEWYKFNGHIWELDKCKSVYNLVDQVALSYEEAINQLDLRGFSDGKFRFYKARINKLRERSGIKNTLDLATAKLPLTQKWDNDPYALAVKNGVIDLRTGELREGKPSDYIKNCTDVEWMGINEDCPRWKKFLSELFPDNPEIPEFLQRLFGYSISGLNVEHVFTVFYGKKGRNGKDVMLATLCNVLGESLASPISKEILISGLKSPGASAPFLYELQGKRLVYSDETSEGAAFDAAQIKMLSGGAPFVAKKLYAQPTIIEPQYLIVITSNSRPIIDADDDALWERLICVEYTQRFVDNPSFENEHEPDKFLKHKLEEEKSGILAWLVQGFLQWQERGLDVPKSVQYNTQDYREEQDSLGRFIKECCNIDRDLQVKVSDLFNAYSEWESADGVKKVSQREFARKMEERFIKTRLSEGYFYQGVGLSQSVEEAIMEYVEQLST